MSFGELLRGIANLVLSTGLVLSMAAGKFNFLLFAIGCLCIMNIDLLRKFWQH